MELKAIPGFLLPHPKSTISFLRPLLEFIKNLIRPDINLRKFIEVKKRHYWKGKQMATIVTGKNTEVKFGQGLPTVIIAERINPTGRKSLAEEIKLGKLDIVESD